MVSGYGARLREKRARLIREFGGRCEAKKYLGIDCDEILSPLQFAHIKPTRINGIGRGMQNRLRDVDLNRDCYALFCVVHHREFDRREQQE